MSGISQRSDLIGLCNKLNLPLNVKSTSIKIYNKIKDKIKIENLLITILVVAAKCEEIHELNIPLRSLKSEGDIHEALDFEYDFPSLYLKMTSILVNLQVNKDLDFTSNYEEACFKMDTLLIKDDDLFSDVEKACTALALPDDIVSSLCELSRVKECKKLLI